MGGLLRMLACSWAERALRLIPSEHRDARSDAAIEVARRYAASLADDSELAAARAAAWDEQIDDIVRVLKNGRE